MLLLENKIDRVLDIIDELALIPSQFGVEDETNEYCGTWELERILRKETGYKLSVYNGCSKLVIVIEGCSKVIKLPFNGRWYYEDKYDEETDEWYQDEEGYFDYFNCDDYCDLEVITYNDAEAAGFGQYLAKASFYRAIKNTYAYVQEKVYTFYDEHASKPSENSLNKIKEKSDYLGNKNWSACFIDFFGEEAFDKFYHYCVYEGDVCIADDLHTGNIGFRADGSPVILDYSGYGENN